MNSLLALLLLVIFFSTFFYAVLYRLQQNKIRKQRVLHYIPVEEEKEISSVTNEKKASPILQGAGRLLQFLPQKQKTQDMLEQAGYKISAAEFTAVRLFVSLIFGLIAWLLMSSLFYGIAGMLAGYIGSGMFVAYKRKKRLDLLTYQLIETLGTMANSLRAGFSFLQAMQLVAKEMPDPLGPEFGRVVREITLGRPVDEALIRMTERLPNKELEVIMQGIVAQRENGGNLAGLLLSMEETIRGRIRVQEELKTLVAQGKMSSWVITLLPVALGLFMYFVNYEYMGIMFEELLGWVMLIVGGMSVFIGWFLIQKVIKIEV
ncbi:type II secretion system F family protein [Alkalicoccus saliphilus]|nr:type II secretion system F family protein [Alkalicoccus saliphilus]